jgi:biopolymer transport protein ExbD
MNVSSEGSNSKGGSQDFEINLAPIIDCFTVLITFMLVSASFLAIGILDAGVEAAGATAENVKPPAVRLELLLLKGSLIELKVSGKSHFDRKISARNNELDMSALESELQTIQKKWPEIQSLTLTAQNDIEYIQIIKIMETSRKVIPSVLLGGF